MNLKEWKKRALSLLPTHNTHKSLLVSWLRTWALRSICPGSNSNSAIYSMSLLIIYIRFIQSHQTLVSSSVKRAFLFTHSTHRYSVSNICQALFSILDIRQWTIEMRHLPPWSFHASGPWEDEMKSF